MISTPTTLLLLGLLACKPTIEGTGTDDSGTADDGTWDGNTGPYLGEEEPSQAADIDTDALGQALTEVLTLSMELSAQPVLDAYAELEPGADPACPEWLDSDGVPYWYDSCTDSNGTTYDGYAIVYSYDGYDGGDGNTYWGDQLYGVASITTTDGRVFEGRGGASLLTGLTKDGIEFSYSLVESGWADSAAEGTWLDSTIDPTFALLGYWYADYDGAATTISGVISGLDQSVPGVEAVVFDQLALYSEVLGGCELEPSTTVSVLDDQGRWLDLVFQAADATDPQCDGCGTAWLDGVEAGQVCADFALLVDWQGSPWD